MRERWFDGCALIHPIRRAGEALCRREKAIGQGAELDAPAAASALAGAEGTPPAPETLSATHRWAHLSLWPTIVDDA